MKDIQVFFPSVGAVVESVTRNLTDGASKDRGYEFADCTFEGACDLGRKGWPAGAARAKKLLDKIALDPKDTHSVTQYDVTGSYVDVGEYVQGTPECMVDFVTDTRTRRFLHIVVAGAYSAGVSAELAMQRGVAIAATVDALEARGIRCSVDVVTIVGTHAAQDDRYTTTVQVKEASAPLNLDALAFAVAHPGFFRRLMFAVEEQQPAEIRQHFGFLSGSEKGIRFTRGGYGRIVPMPKYPGAYVFPVASWTDKEAWSEKATLARIENILNDKA